MYLVSAWSQSSSGEKKSYSGAQETCILNTALLWIMNLLWQTSLLCASENEMFGLNGIQIPSSTNLHDVKVCSPSDAGWWLAGGRQLRSRGGDLDKVPFQEDG